MYAGVKMKLPRPLIYATKNKTAAIVLNLIEPLLDCGHTLWVDNCFNSLSLAHFLKMKGTNPVHTLCMKKKPLVKLLSKKTQEGRNCWAAFS
jgi:hypothetical protein